jgi:hypothetical protein
VENEVSEFKVDCQKTKSNRCVLSSVAKPGDVSSQKHMIHNSEFHRLSKPNAKQRKATQSNYAQQYKAMESKAKHYNQRKDMQAMQRKP